MGKPVPASAQISESVPRPLCRRAPLPFRRTPSEACDEILALNFLFSHSVRTILNCAVIGADTNPYFHVVTRADFRPGHTVFRTNRGDDVAEVEWVPDGGGAYVELHDKTLKKQHVSAWLGISRDASYRMMCAHGEKYVWVPRSHCICLYHWDPKCPTDVPELLAKIVKVDDIVTLEISVTAIEAGLLEMCVVCVVLFQSGYPID